MWSSACDVVDLTVDNKTEEEIALESVIKELGTEVLAKCQKEIDILFNLVEKNKSKTVNGLSRTHESLVGNCPNCSKFVRAIDNPNYCECNQRINYGKINEEK